MNKTKLLTAAIIAVLASFSVLNSCAKDEDKQEQTTPLNNGTDIRNLILVISDIHLGDEVSYEQCNTNRAYLVNFLEQVRTSPNVKELVIAGDLFDEWFIPDTIDTYKGGSQATFIQRIAETNKTVFDALNNLIQDGKVLVTYTPGNHDLAVEASNVELALPGINQARDEGLLGLGTYSPAGHPEIAIEHGHRYNLFCAPDPLSNQTIAPGTILPPGYFYTRIAATHLTGDCLHNIDTLPTVTPNLSGDPSQQNLYAYWLMWNWAINAEAICKPFSQKDIVTNVNGFTDRFCVLDIVPHQQTPGGTIEVDLFDGIQDQEKWATRCNLNHVLVPIPIGYALANANAYQATDTMSYWQYFNNQESQVRIVIFGHSHVPLMKSYTISDKKYIYANSGTWIDKNPLSSQGMNVVIITPQSSDASTQTHVRLYSFDKQQYVLMNEDSLRY